jgi:hypothetical protein
MEQVLLYLLFLVPVIVANLSERQRRLPRAGDEACSDSLRDLMLRYLPHGLLVAINLGLLGIGGCLSCWNRRPWPRTGWGWPSSRC